MIIELPWPPSINHYYVRTKARVVIGKRGRKYRRDVGYLVKAHPRGNMPAHLGRIGIEIAAHPPDKRTHDLDNIQKALLDSLTHADVWGDDGQVDDIHIYRAPVVKHGAVVVKIWRMPD